MENIFVEFLPHWVETGLQPAFYDKESGTVLQQTARMYARVNMLIRMFNKLSKQTKNEIERFEDEVNETVQEYIEKFNQLHDYVEDYFDNLDVQEEIDNKLDDMVEAGTLQEIIADYLNSKALFGYDTVADMKSATNLIDGSYATTLGYYSINDNGGAVYKISETQPLNGYYETLESGLYAILVFDETISLDQCGCYGDGTHDDTTKIKSIITLAKSDKLKIVGGKNKTYLITESIDLSNLYVDMNMSTITTSEAIDMIVIDTQNYYGEFKNAVIDCNGVATCGIKVSEARKMNISYCDIINIKTYGLSYLVGYELTVSHMNLQGTTTDNSTGLYVRSGDSNFSDIIMIDCKTAIDNANGANYYNNIHAWILTPGLLAGSIFYKCSGGYGQFLNNCYSDTYQYTIYQHTQIPSLSITNMFNVYNHGIYTQEIATDNQPEFMHCESANGNALVRMGQSILYGYSNAINTKLTNLTSFDGDIVDCKITDFDHNLPYTSLDTTSATTTSVVSSKVEKSNKLVSIRHIAVCNTDDSKTFTIGTLPYYYRPTTEYIGMCSYGPGTWSSDGVAYVYIGINGVIQVTLPSTVSGNKTVKLNIQYFTPKEI